MEVSIIMFDIASLYSRASHIFFGHSYSILYTYSWADSLLLICTGQIHVFQVKFSTNKGTSQVIFVKRIIKTGIKCMTNIPAINISLNYGKISTRFQKFPTFSYVFLNFCKIYAEWYSHIIINHFFQAEDKREYRKLSKTGNSMSIQLFISKFC